MLNTGAGTSWTEAPRNEVLDHLSKILESPQFRASKKCTRFLRHVVESAIESRFDSLKERTIGVDVFDRDPNYDTNQDPIVRGTAGEVRKRLAQYYLEAGQQDQLRLSLPPGTYVPELQRVIASPKQVQTEPVIPVPAPAAVAEETAATPSRSRIVAVAAAGVAAVIGAALLYFPFRPTPLDRFWGPVFEGSKNILVCLGQPQEYAFRPNTARALNDWFANPDRRDPPPPSIASVPIGEIIPLWGTTVALSDTQAFEGISNLFARKGKEADLRGQTSLSLSDLRGRPSVLIGAFDNDWTLKLGGELRFYFDQDEQAHVQTIRDRQNPRQSQWTLVDAWPPGKKIDHDYALVSRVQNRTTEKTLITLAGISQYGTEAAAEFVTKPEYFAAALVNAPKDWDRKNMQVVLATRVISGVSGPPRVIAVYFW